MNSDNGWAGSYGYQREAQSPARPLPPKRELSPWMMKRLRACTNNTNAMDIIAKLYDYGLTSEEAANIIISEATPTGPFSMFLSIIGSIVEQQYEMIRNSRGHSSYLPIRAEQLRPEQLTAVPPREFLYAGHYARGFISATLAGGGVGKSSLAAVEALAMVTGQNLLGFDPGQKRSVWVINGEDPLAEMQRRFAGAMRYYGISADEIRGLRLTSGRDTPITVAEITPDGFELRKDDIQELKSIVEKYEIEIIILDPMVSFHRLPENDNVAIDKFIKSLGQLADELDVSIDILHHLRKTGGHEATVEDARGAIALVAGARSVRILQTTTKDEGERASVDNHRLHFRVENGKANMAPAGGSPIWYQFHSVPLHNGPSGTVGDVIGVVSQWRWPNPLDQVTAADLLAVQKAIEKKPWRENPQAKEWVGIPIAEVLKLDIARVPDRARIKALIKEWFRIGALQLERRHDESRKERSFVKVGIWANCATSQGGLEHAGAAPDPAAPPPPLL